MERPNHVCHTVVLAICLWLVLPGPVSSAPTSSTSLDGWWQARIEHGGETADIYLEFFHDGAKQLGRMSIPWTAGAPTDLGPVTVTDSQVDLQGVGWTFQRKEGGAVLVTEIPKELIPVHHVVAQFRRAVAPSPVTPVQGYETPPKPIWTHETGAPIWGDVTYDVSSGLLFVSNDEGTTLALQSATGAQVWSVRSSTSIRSQPVLAGDSLYVSGDTRVLKLDKRSGGVRWSTELGRGQPTRLPITDPKSSWDYSGSAPALRKDVVYVTSRDGCLYALGAANGAVAWKSCVGSLLTGTPTLAGGRILFGGFDGNVYAADAANGRILWKRDTLGPVPRQVVVAGQTALAGSRSYDLVAVDLASGRPMWSSYFWFSWVDSVPVVADHTFYVGSSDAVRVFALDLNTGRKQWVARVPGWAWAQPTIAGATIYAGTVGGPQALGARMGAFVAIDRSDGRVRWIYPAKQARDDQLWGFAAGAAAADNRVYAADLSGRVIALAAR